MQPEMRDGADDGLGILTPAERRVLDYVRHGTIDAEIAVRLGIPVGDVKARIESMLHKLHLESRAELAVWLPTGPHAPPARPPEPEPAGPKGPDEVQSPEEGEGPHHHGEHLTWRLSSGTVFSLVLVALAALGALGFMLTQGGSRGPLRATQEEPPTATSTLEPTATPTAGPSWGGIEAEQVRIVPGDAITPDLALVMWVGREQPGGGTILRMSHSTKGVVRDVLLDPAGQLLHVIARPDGREIVASVCAEGSCDPSRAPRGRQQLLRSVDGGVTWKAYDLPEMYNLLGFRGGTAVLVPYSGNGLEWSLFDFESGSIVVEDMVREGEPLGGSGWWTTSNATLIDDAGVRRRVTGLDENDRITEVAPLGSMFFLSWSTFSGASGPTSAVGRFMGGAPKHVVTLPAGASFQPVQALEMGRVAGTLYTGGDPGSPAVLDFDQQTVAPIALAPGTIFPGVALSVMSGPFARVVGAGQGDCLNIREAPAADAAVRACYRDNTLLRRGSLGFVDAAGTRWLQVANSDLSVQGYASIDFLEVLDVDQVKFYPAEQFDLGVLSRGGV